MATTLTLGDTPATAHPLAPNLGTPHGQSATGNLRSTTTRNLGSIPTVEAALRSILQEVMPGQRPYSGDSYLPAHLVQAARDALNDNSLAASQHAHNALSTAAWHIARGEPAKALARMRRAKSHIMASMEGGAA